MLQLLAKNSLMDTKALLRCWLARLRHSRVQTEAAAMSFISLLALVPALILLAWLISKLPRAISDIARIQQILLKLIVPESVSVISDTIASMLQRIDSIPLVALPLLLLSITGLMNNLEKAFNHIFEVPPRRLLARILYICITIVVGPILLALTLASTQLIPALGLIGWINPSFYLSVLPTVIEIAALTCMYQLVPSRSIGWRLSFLAGTIVAATLAALRELMQKILVELGSYEVLYGIFAAIPLFFLWVYSFWLVVFILAILIHSMESFKQPAENETASNQSITENKTDQ